jgi:CRISPR-associated protein Csm3
MAGFWEFKNRYFVTAELVLTAPLHIGKGVSLEPGSTDLPVVKDNLSRPFIPGSSVKGVMRSEVERIARSLQSTFKFKPPVCDPLTSPCINPEKKRELAEQCEDDKSFYSAIWTESCVVCQLFGSPWLASRISFRDMSPLAGELFHPFEVRDGVAIDRDTGTVSGRAKFDYEVTVSGLRFHFEAMLENVEPWEVGLIYLVLQLWKRGELALGGKTTSGLGWGELRNIIITRVMKEMLLEYILEAKTEKVEPDELIAQLMKRKQGGE